MIRSAGMVIVRRVREDTLLWKFLFLRAYRNWDFPKGLVKEGEDPFETAKREVAEETGITRLTFPWGKEYKETEPYLGSGGKKVARYYMAETRQSRVVFSVNPRLGRPEHHEYRWVPPEQVRDLAPGRLEPVIQWALDKVPGRT